ncbi:MAG: GNAT family N-acetyltransferase, partial [Pseudomonadota bacterium]
LLRRARAGREAEAHPKGFVLIEADAALAEEMRANLATESTKAADWEAATFSVAHRGSGGEIEAAGQVHLSLGLAEIRQFWVAPALRGEGLGAKLLAEIEAEARRRGASRAALDVYTWQAPAFFERQGYRAIGRLDYPGGAERVWFVKDLA